MIRVPDEIEEALRHAVAVHIDERDRRGGALTRAIVRRSHLYTSERAELLEREPERGPSAADVAARALFFSVADAAKVFVPMAELAGRGLLPTGRPLRVLDIGAGAGAMTLGVLAFAAEHGVTELSVRAIDRDRRALDILQTAAESLAEVLDIEVDVEVEVGDVRREGLGEGAVDLIVAGSVLNELGEPEAVALARDLIASVAGDGALIIIEPALRETSRALHRLRDRLLDDGIAHVFAPCCRTSTPCPALEDESDWCHEDRPVQLPPLVTRLAVQTNLRQHGLKMSYLVLRRDDQGLVGGAEPGRRIVSRPRKLKGQLECFVCGQSGRERLRVLKRNKGTYRRLSRARRGEVLIERDGELVVIDPTEG
jgi:ribosomal protein RSM22 (predicted rRNA methylase)